MTNIPDRFRLLLKSHVKGFYRKLPTGEVVYVTDHDDKRPQGRPATLSERTAMGKHKSGTHYLRATDAEDADEIKSAADRLGISVTKRRAGASHRGRVGAYDHFHVEDPAHAEAILTELKKKDALGPPEMHEPESVAGGKAAQLLKPKDPAAETNQANRKGADEETPDARVEHKHRVSTVEFGKNDGRAVLHPEHQDQVGKLGDGESTFFQDEQGERWDVQRKGEHLHFQARGNSGLKGKVRQDQFQAFPKTTKEPAKPTTAPPLSGPRPTEEQSYGHLASDLSRGSGTLKDMAKGLRHESQAISAHGATKAAQTATLKGDHAQAADAHTKAANAHLGASTAAWESEMGAHAAIASRHRVLAKEHQAHVDAHANLSGAKAKIQAAKSPAVQEHLITQSGQAAAEESKKADASSVEAHKLNNKEYHMRAAGRHSSAGYMHRAAAAEARGTTEGKGGPQVPNAESTAKHHEAMAEHHGAEESKHRQAYAALDRQSRDQMARVNEGMKAHAAAKKGTPGRMAFSKGEIDRMQNEIGGFTDPKHHRAIAEAATHHGLSSGSVKNFLAHKAARHSNDTAMGQTTHEGRVEAYKKAMDPKGNGTWQDQWLDEKDRKAATKKAKE